MRSNGHGSYEPGILVCGFGKSCFVGSLCLCGLFGTLLLMIEILHDPIYTTTTIRMALVHEVMQDFYQILSAVVEPKPARKLEHESPLASDPTQNKEGTPACITLNPYSNFLESTVYAAHNSSLVWIPYHPSITPLQRSPIPFSNPGGGACLGGTALCCGLETSAQDPGLDGVQQRKNGQPSTPKDAR